MHGKHITLEDNLVNISENKLSDKTCRRINVIISKYNLPRYPSEKSLYPDDVEEDIKFIEEFIDHQIVTIL